MSHKKSSKIKVYFYTELIVFIILTINFAIMYFFADKILPIISESSAIFSWFFTLTLGAMIPGIIYKGGDGYSKLTKGGFITKEKGFLFLFLDLIIITIIIFISGFVFNWIFLFVTKYIILILIEWILLFYVTYTRIRDYTFPTFYFLVTNIIIILWWVLTYLYT